MGAGCPRAIGDIDKRLTKGTLFASVPRDVIALILNYYYPGPCFKGLKKYKFKTTCPNVGTTLNFIAIQPITGNIFVSDVAKNTPTAIHVLNPAGVPIRSFVLNDCPVAPLSGSDIMDSRGALVFIQHGALVVVGGPFNNMLFKIDPHDGHVISELQMEKIHAICANKEGHVVVLVTYKDEQYGNQILKIFDHEFKLQQTIEMHGQKPQYFGIASDPHDGRFYWSESIQSIYIYTSEGTKLPHIQRNGSSKSVGGILVDGAGHVGVCVAYDHMIKWISNETGNAIGSLLCRCATGEMLLPRNFVLDGRGNILVVAGSHAVYVFH